MTTLADAIANPAGYPLANGTKLDQLHTDLLALEGYVDGLETLVTATNVAIAATNTKLDTLNTDLGTANTSLGTIATNASSTADSPVEAHQPCDVITFTPTLDTAAYSSGDVLFATAALAGVTRANDLRALLSSLTVIDKAKQNAAITLLFYQTNVTSAAANAANALSDADQLSLMGTFDIASADWKTWANNSTVCYGGAKSPGLLLEAASGTTTIYVVAITTSTPTFAVGDLVFKFGFVQQ